MGKFSKVARLVPVAVLALHALPAQSADEPRVFAPSNDWSVSSDGESCVISRQFGDDGVTFGLQTFSPASTFYNGILRGDALPHRDGGALDIEFRFGPDTEAISATGVLSGGTTPRLTFAASLEPASVLEARRNGEPRPPMIDTLRETAVDEFVITFSRGRPLLLQLGSMAAPLGQLRECAAALPEKWGLDPVVQRSLSRPPIPIDMDSWLGPGSYPWEYLRNALSVRVFLRLMTDEQGAVSQCIVQSPKGENVAGAVACREIAKSAQFEPALDSEGEAAPSYYATSIFFHTPRNNGPLSGGNRRQTLCC